LLVVGYYRFVKDQCPIIITVFRDIKTPNTI